MCAPSVDSGLPLRRNMGNIRSHSDELVSLVSEGITSTFMSRQEVSFGN